MANQHANPDIAKDNTENKTKNDVNESTSATSSTIENQQPVNVFDPFNIQALSQIYLTQLDQFHRAFLGASTSMVQASDKQAEPTPSKTEPSNTPESSTNWLATNPFVANLGMWQNVFNNVICNANQFNTVSANTDPVDSQIDNSKTHANKPSQENGKVSTIPPFNESAQRFVTEALKRSTQTSQTSQSLMFEWIDGWQQLTTGMLSNSPTTLFEQQMNLCHQQMQLYQNTVIKTLGGDVEPVITPKKGDKRFTDEEWSDQPFFDFLKQSYLLTVDNAKKTIDNAKGLDDKTRQRLAFFTRQWLNAMAPSNFLWSNPEILRLTLESEGQNLITGLKQLAEDMEKSANVLSIRMTDKQAFELGGNIATSAGKVVFRNRMFELIQYTPTTAKSHKRPLLIVPPWINKFYIMDLTEKNSYIRWALDEGHSVFVISWVNPTRAYKDVGMETYMHEGLLTALDVVGNITGEPDANVIGYCIGGMLLALTLSWLQENNQSERIASATFWTTLFDFSEPGDLGVFIDDRIVTALEQEEEQKGVFDGRMMGVAFSLLRENSLYWNYYVQNYLKGERPIPFDLLYWNSDCTNVTAALHSFILRELYLGNKMIEKGALDFSGIKIDLSKVTTPVYVVATLKDHIAKWEGSYAATQVFGGDVTFVLGESGHIAGIINPPDGKYGFYTYDGASKDNANNTEKNSLDKKSSLDKNRYPESPEDWFEKAERHDNSWWLHWGDWIKQYSAGSVDARQPGVDKQGQPWQTLEDAPGSYVKVTAQEALQAVTAV